VDELCCFVQKKARNVRKDDPEEFGDQWIYVAMDANTKAVIHHAVGDRTMFFAQEFMWNLYHRISGRTQLTTDGLPHYKKAVPECFGTDVDFAQVVKLFGDYGQHGSNAKYSPGPIVEVISKVRSGNPEPSHISTRLLPWKSNRYPR
jgi:IS1 family transposase